ncbi:MAG TPA: TlyA family RNA methyltransferase [Bacilli bacterium]|mgnify:CR=1 FL=1|nr:TlyA family RNA methyltransferase [Bacilli bacterium]
MIRIDIELVKRKLFTTRNKAQDAISSGIIFCDGKKVVKSSKLIKSDSKIEIKGDIMPFVSKGGLKLAKAIKSFNINLKNKIMIDIGSSTGGFSDCALQSDVKKIIAIDVGTNQFDKNLKQDKRINLYEKQDFRDVDNNILKDANIATIDVSFISVTKLIPKIEKIKSLKEIVCLIKPQFECGKKTADKYQGIVLDKTVHKEIINKIILPFQDINFFCQDVTFSPICGGDGNIEYLGYFIKNGTINNKINVDNVVGLAFKDLL